MKSLFVTAFLLVIASSYGATSEQKKSVLEAQRSCGNFVRFNDEYLFQGFGPYKVLFEDPRMPIPGYFRRINLTDSTSQQYSTNDSVLDIVTDQNHAFILTYSSLEEWDLNAGIRMAEHPTHTTGGTRAYKEHAEGLARYEDKLIIAHGRLGVSFFDMKSKVITKTLKLIPSQSPMESQATAVAVQGKFAYVIMDSFSLVSTGKRPFSGVVVIDLETETVINEFSGMDNGSDAVSILNNKMIVSFYGHPIWKYDLADFKGTKLPEPKLRMSRFPMSGHPYGSAAMDEKYYYTCFMHTDSQERPYLKPTALNRKTLMLD